MSTLNVNVGEFRFEGGSFVPDRRRPEPYGANPRIPLGRGAYSGLIVIGLRGQGGEEFKPEEVIDFVKETRLGQAGDPGASFLFQRGLYKHKVTGETVEEPSLRIIILNIAPGEPRPEFKEHIGQLAEDLAEEFNQESVILEFQDRGVTDEIFEVLPEDENPDDEQENEEE